MRENRTAAMSDFRLLEKVKNQIEKQKSWLQRKAILPHCTHNFSTWNLFYRVCGFAQNNTESVLPRPCRKHIARYGNELQIHRAIASDFYQRISVANIAPKRWIDILLRSGSSDSPAGQNFSLIVRGIKNILLIIMRMRWEYIYPLSGSLRLIQQFGA